MKLKLYQVDAFTDEVFRGNPAAVVPLEAWLDDSVMQAIAAENNLSETAFVVPAGNGFHVRWFTPLAEEKLCGHATLASAFVLFNELGYVGETVRFISRSGDLFVSRKNNSLVLDFPASFPTPVESPAALVAGLNIEPTEVVAALDYIAVYRNEDEIRALQPDYEQLKTLDRRDVCVTAPGKSADFVSRFFAPKEGINEDPVTGSAHCELVPFWAARLNKTNLTARQLSKRQGSLECTLRGDRVLIAGQCVKYMEAVIELPNPSPCTTDNIGNTSDR